MTEVLNQLSSRYVHPYFETFMVLTGLGRIHRVKPSQVGLLLSLFFLWTRDETSDKNYDCYVLNQTYVKNGDQQRVNKTT